MKTWVATTSVVATVFSLSGCIKPVHALAVSPATATVDEFHTQTFSYSYRWYFEGAPLTRSGVDARRRDLILTDVTADSAGTYYCVLTRVDNVVTVSSTARLFVRFPPEVLAEPNPFVRLSPNETFSIYVTAVGYPEPTYQWSKDGWPMAGEVFNTLTIDTVAMADDGRYTVAVSNTAGSIVSQTAVLRINTAPSISSLSPNITVNPGDRVEFNVGVTGSPFPSIQWFKDGLVLAGETFVSLVITSADQIDAGSYEASVWNDLGTVTSSIIILEVNVPPQIVDQSEPFMSVLRGHPVNLSVDVVGTWPLSYVWRKDGTVLSDFNSAEYFLPEFSGSSASYEVTVNNSAGIASAQFQITGGTVPNVNIALYDKFNRTRFYVGDTISFGITSLAGMPQPSVQWFYNGAEWGEYDQTLSVQLSSDMIGALSVSIEVTNIHGSVSVESEPVSVQPLPIHALEIGVGLSLANAHCSQLSSECGLCTQSSEAFAGDCAYCLGGSIDGCMAGVRHDVDSRIQCEASGGIWFSAHLDDPGCPATTTTTTTTITTTSITFTTNPIIIASVGDGSSNDDASAAVIGSVVVLIAISAMVVGFVAVRTRRERESQRKAVQELQDKLDAAESGLSNELFQDYTGQLQDRLQQFFTTRETDGGGLHEMYAMASMIKAIPRQIDPKSIRIDEKLGAGQFGDVFSGTLELGGENVQQVALKVLSKENPEESETTSFLAESALMAQFDHPNIIRLVGVVTESKPIVIVTELAEFGSLDKYLRQHQVDDMMRVVFALDIAAGMQYLENCGFIHRDLAARNVLVTAIDQRTCKIGDFGLSRTCGIDDDFWSDSWLIAIRWTAPEVMHVKKFTRKTDVWSYGVLLYELWTNAALPYGKKWDNMKVIREVDKGYRLKCPDGCLREVYVIMMSCWHPVPGLRPPFARVINRLASVLAAIEPDEEGLDAHKERINAIYAESAALSSQIRPLTPGSDFRKNYGRSVSPLPPDRTRQISPAGGGDINSTNIVSERDLPTPSEIRRERLNRLAKAMSPSMSPLIDSPGLLPTSTAPASQASFKSSPMAGRIMKKPGVLPPAPEGQAYMDFRQSQLLDETIDVQRRESRGVLRRLSQQVRQSWMGLFSHHSVTISDYDHSMDGGASQSLPGARDSPSEPRYVAPTPTWLRRPESLASVLTVEELEEKQGDCSARSTPCTENNMLQSASYDQSLEIGDLNIEGNIEVLRSAQRLKLARTPQDSPDLRFEPDLTEDISTLEDGEVEITNEPTCAQTNVALKSGNEQVATHNPADIGVVLEDSMYVDVRPDATYEAFNPKAHKPTVRDRPRLSGTGSMRSRVAALPRLSVQVEEEGTDTEAENVLPDSRKHSTSSGVVVLRHAAVSQSDTDNRNSVVSDAEQMPVMRRTSTTNRDNKVVVVLPRPSDDGIRFPNRRRGVADQGHLLESVKGQDDEIDERKLTSGSSKSAPLAPVVDDRATVANVTKNCNEQNYADGVCAESDPEGSGLSMLVRSGADTLHKNHVHSKRRGMKSKENDVVTPSQSRRAFENARMEARKKNHEEILNALAKLELPDAEHRDVVGSSEHTFELSRPLDQTPKKLSDAETAFSPRPSEAEF